MMILADQSVILFKVKYDNEIQNNKKKSISDLIYWGQDFIEDCSGAQKNLVERNNDWWTRYSDRIRKFKEKMETVSKCN